MGTDRDRVDLLLDLVVAQHETIEIIGGLARDAYAADRANALASYVIILLNEAPTLTS